MEGEKKQHRLWISVRWEKDHSSPNIDLQAIGDQELYGIDMATQVQRCVSLIISGQQISSKLVQEAADVHIPSGGSQVEAGATPVVTDVGVTPRL